MGSCESSTAKSPEATIEKKSEASAVPDLYLTKQQKLLLQKHFRASTLAQNTDIFHKTLVICINTSPKLNEILGCQQYAIDDLTKWPKLNHVCESQKILYTDLIYDLDLEPAPCYARMQQLGRMHVRNLQYGFKPHFLDLWQLQFENQLDKTIFEGCEEDRPLYFKAFATLNDFIIDMLATAHKNEKPFRSRDNSPTGKRPT